MEDAALKVEEEVNNILIREGWDHQHHQVYMLEHRPRKLEANSTAPLLQCHPPVCTGARAIKDSC